jgi:L-ascorbate metabolism protein UlaG (beta-lactamase superfamily)
MTPGILRRLAPGARRIGMVVAAVALVGFAALWWLWRVRPSLDSIDWPPYPAADEASDTVTVTWLGVTTLLFDDGDTQILIDGFISRPSLADIVLGRPVQSDAARIDYVLEAYDMRRLAAIVPVHSHFDHAMDVGAIANRTSASILGSETTANIARGAGVPEDQIIVVENHGQYSFGQFTLTMIESAHAPILWGGKVPFAGSIDHPLKTPAPVSAWRAGKSYSIVVAHPLGTTVVQGSAGFVTGALDGVHADVVMLGVGMLESMGRKYAAQYWQQVVTTTGAEHVIPIHFDDYTRPFGEIVPVPRALNDFGRVAGWLEDFRDTWDRGTRLHLPRFGEAIVLYPLTPPEA